MLVCLLNILFILLYFAYFKHVFNFTSAASGMDAVYWIHVGLWFHVLQDLDTVPTNNQITKRHAGWFNDFYFYREELRPSWLRGYSRLEVPAGRSHPWARAPGTTASGILKLLFLFTVAVDVVEAMPLYDVIESRDVINRFYPTTFL